MAYNVAGLPAYTSQQSRVFITRTILGTATIALLTQFGSFDPTAKGSQAIQLIDTDVTIQDGTTCGRNPIGGATLTQATLTVKELKINQNYCVKDLVTTWAVEELKATMKGLPYTDALFLEDIGRINSDKAALKLEQMIWQGDTAVADLSLKQINGFIKQIKAGAYINLNPVPGVGDGKIITRLRAIDAAMPIAVTAAADYRVLMGQDYAKRYYAELADKNLFAVPGSENMIWGTKSQFVELPGLNGTNVIIASRIRNLRAGGEMTAAKFEKMFSVETKQTYFDSDFSLGVVPILIDEIGLGDYTAV